MSKVHSFYHNLRLSFKKIAVLAFTTVMASHLCLLMFCPLVSLQNIASVEPIVIISSFLFPYLYLQGQTRHILPRRIAIMEQRKLNRKKAAFIIIVALIFILPLVAIG